MNIDKVSFTAGFRLKGDYNDIKNIENQYFKQGYTKRFINIGSPEKKVNTFGVANGQDGDAINKLRWELLDKKIGYNVSPRIENAINTIWGKFNVFTTEEFSKAVKNNQFDFDTLKLKLDKEA